MQTLEEQLLCKEVCNVAREQLAKLRGLESSVRAAAARLRDAEEGTRAASFVLALRRGGAEGLAEAGFRDGCGCACLSAKGSAEKACC